MPSMDVFLADGFSMLELTAAVNKQDYLPQRLLELGLFEPIPVASTVVAIEERGGVLALVPTSPRGAPGATRDHDKRKLIDLRVPHLALEERIMADEVQNIRAFGSQSEVMQVQQLVNQRSLKLRRDVELTHENFRLGAVKGQVLDADASVLLDLFVEFGVTQLTEVDFDLDNASPASGALRKKCASVVRSVLRELKGLGGGNIRIRALCSDAFWDDLIAHKEVRETYLQTEEARELRGGAAYGVFNFGGLTFENYRGTDDGTTVGVAADKCHLFPENVPGLFQLYFAPADYEETVNSPGLPFYARQAPDSRFNKFTDLEVQSNPLAICTVPRVLIQGKRT